LGSAAGIGALAPGDVELLQIVHTRMLPSGGALGVSVEEAGGDGADRAHDGGCVDTGLVQPGFHSADPPLSASREHAGGACPPRSCGGLRCGATRTPTSRRAPTCARSRLRNSLASPTRSTNVPARHSPGLGQRVCSPTKPRRRPPDRVHPQKMAGGSRSTSARRSSTLTEAGTRSYPWNFRLRSRQYSDHSRVAFV